MEEELLRSHVHWKWPELQTRSVNPVWDIIRNASILSHWLEQSS